MAPFTRGLVQRGVCLALMQAALRHHPLPFSAAGSQERAAHLPFFFFFLVLSRVRNLPRERFFQNTRGKQTWAGRQMVTSHTCTEEPTRASAGHRLEAKRFRFGPHQTRIWKKLPGDNLQAAAAHILAQRDLLYSKVPKEVSPIGAGFAGRVHHGQTREKKSRRHTPDKTKSALRLPS